MAVHNSSHLRSDCETTPHMSTHTLTHSCSSFQKWPPDSLFPLLIPVRPCHYKKKVQSSYSSVPYLSIPYFLWALIWCNLPPLPGHSTSQSVPLFSEWQKIYDNKIPDAAESEGWPKGEPAILISLSVALFTHLHWWLWHTAAATHRSHFPSHTRYCLSLTAAPPELISFRAPAANTHVHTRRQWNF